MRLTSAIAAVALTGSVLVLTPTAQAMPSPGHGRVAHARLFCETYVVGADSTGHATYDVVRNSKVRKSFRSKRTFKFDVTALGSYDSVPGNGLLLSAISADGTPRQVKYQFGKGGRVALTKYTKKYRQKSFTPRLFADNYGFYAYTVGSSGKLERYSLTRYPNGSLKYAQKITLGGDFADLTSLLATQFYRIRGRDNEMLFATTSSGELLQITIPVNKPRKFKVRTLASTGYAGVTELSWSVCNNNSTYVTLVAIDPSAGTATWTTVKNVTRRPKSTLRGPITGGKGWDLVAAL